MKQSLRAQTAFKRLLRVLFLLVWLLLILTPCMALLLASQGEFRMRTGPAPEQETRLWLVQEARRAGLALSYASVFSSDSERCFQTDVRFLLWRAQNPDEETAATFCSCYPLADSEFQTPQVSAAACVSGAAGNHG